MTEYRWIDGLCDISEFFDLFLIDQFGVLHDGIAPYDEAIECLTNLRARGKKVVLCQTRASVRPPIFRD